MPLSASSKTIQSLSTPAGEIEYFEDYQMRAILNAPSTEKQSECRNKMLLILGYDAAMRIGEFHGDIPDMEAPLFYSVTHGGYTISLMTAYRKY